MKSRGVCYLCSSGIVSPPERFIRNIVLREVLYLSCRPVHYGLFYPLMKENISQPLPPPPGRAAGAPAPPRLAPARAARAGGGRTRRAVPVQGWVARSRIWTQKKSPELTGVVRFAHPSRALFRRLAWIVLKALSTGLCTTVRSSSSLSLCLSLSLCVCVSPSLSLHMIRRENEREEPSYVPQVFRFAC